MERSKENKHLVCDKDDDSVDNDDQDGVDNGDDDSVDNSDDSDDGDDCADKHLTYLSQAADYCLAERSK
eukprot:13440167-Ditylum_brightwellii.AAC.1